MSEWHGSLAVGSIKVNVSFVGGTASPSGMKPAYLTTKDPIVQFVIEHSGEYKRGEIFLVSKQETPGVHPRMAVPKAVAPAVEPQGGEGDNQPSETAGTVEAAGGDEETKTGSGVKRVEVADKGEAIEWLKEHNPEAGYTATKLRTREAFDNACQECGVEFVYQ